ncbi:MAG: hypothetical protein EBZ13_06850, partial [Planctomycetia bacterium]|nr:hypothetical protein [Planctomycetia bacterium]
MVNASSFSGTLRWPLRPSQQESLMQGTLPSSGTSADTLSPADAAGAPSWIRDARQIIKQSSTDFFKVSPLRYWTDFLVSLVLAYGSATVYLLSPLGSWQQLVAFPMAVFWLYRLGSL